jgi:prevent-host-death family protein
MYHQMTTATVRDLRNHFSELSKKLAKGETVQILSRGKPIARLVPESQTLGTWVGAGKGTAVFPDDFDEPMNLPWDALK